MEIDAFFYRIFKTDSRSEPLAYLGTAFPVVPNGGLLTCRHVVDIPLGEGELVSVFDGETLTFTPIKDMRFPADATLDVAYLPNALGRAKAEFLPLLERSLVLIGEDVYSFGYFTRVGEPTNPEPGYLKGNIVNIRKPTTSRPGLTLSYPVIEGLSGAPVLTYYNGPKVVGMAYGSLSSRVVASEYVKFEHGEVELEETIHRIVEFGLAHHCTTLLGVAAELGVDVLVTTENPRIPGLA